MAARAAPARRSSHRAGSARTLNRRDRAVLQDRPVGVVRRLLSWPAMFISRVAVVVLMLTAATAVAGPPSDARIKKDLMAPGILKLRFTGGPGTVAMNTDTMTREYTRRVELTQTTEYPGIKVILTGDAVYQRVGAEQYRYWKFRVYENRYDGIPNPTVKEIEATLDTDRPAVFGGLANMIVKVIEPPRLAEPPAWNWHDPKSVSFEMTAKVDLVKNNTELETVAVTLEVRLYRDDLKAPWKSFLGSTKKREPLGRSKHTYDEIKNMPRLAQQAREVEAKARAEKLPAVTLPEFASAEDLGRYVHKVLREGPRERAEAVLRALIAPRHYVSGSSVRLGSDAEEMLTHALDAAFRSPGGYAEQYCATPNIDMRGSSTTVSIIGVKSDLVTQLRAQAAGGKLVDGVEVGARLMLDDVAVRTRNDDKTRAYIASFTDRKKLCPAD
jgi:hypothetical protein